MEKLTQPDLQLCSADYTATLVQVPDGAPTVFILAQGVHVTSGYEVFFHKTLDVYPPQFSLWHSTPVGPVLEVITPFAKFESFEIERGKTIDSVKITDAKGVHNVPVKQLGRALCS